MTSVTRITWPAFFLPSFLAASRTESLLPSCAVARTDCAILTAAPARFLADSPPFFRASKESSILLGGSYGHHVPLFTFVPPLFASARTRAPRDAVIEQRHRLH